MSDENTAVVAAVAEPEILMTESEKNFANQTLKDIKSTFDLATTVMAIASQISLPKEGNVKVCGQDIMQFMGLARAMHLNPVMGGVYGFKSKDGKLTLGVSKKGWQQALNSQPDFAGLTYKLPDAVEKRMSDGRDTFTVLYYPYATCIIKKILPNGQVGEFEGTAYFDEEFDPKKQTWSRKPKRMLQTRALTVAASNAYGWGAYEPDELGSIPTTSVNTVSGAPAIPATATVVDEKTLLINKVNRAGTYEDIIQLFKGAPDELRKDADVINACKTAKAELELL